MLLLHQTSVVAQEQDDSFDANPNGAGPIVFRPHVGCRRQGTENDERARLPASCGRHGFDLQWGHDRVASAGQTVRHWNYASDHGSWRRTAGRLPQPTARRAVQSGSVGRQSGLPFDDASALRAQQSGASLSSGMPTLDRQFGIKQPSQPAPGNHPQSGSDSSA